jgi:hypothetical protein
MKYQVNLEQAAAEQELDITFMQEIVGDFYNNNISLPNSIQQLANTKQYSEISLKIHDLKNTACIIGASGLADIVRQVDAAIQTNTLDNIDTLLTECVRGIEETCQCCKDLMVSA